MLANHLWRDGHPMASPFSNAGCYAIALPCYLPKCPARGAECQWAGLDELRESERPRLLHFLENFFEEGAQAAG